MTFKFNELMVIFPEQIWVELSPEKKQEAWLIVSSQLYSNAAAQRNAYLNKLCLDAFESWLKDDKDLYHGFQLLCQPNELPSFWEILNGTELSLGSNRLALIPCEKSCLQEFRIQQEWVDIPQMAANYYLPVQINLAENWLRIWGYTSYEQIRKQAIYDGIDRTYVLNGEDLITDLNVMWVSCSKPAHHLPEIVRNFINLSPVQVEELLEKLSKTTAYSPRLNVAFPEWAAIIASDKIRQQLYQRRLLCLLEKQQAPQENKLGVNNLSQWFENIFEDAWQSLEMLLNFDETTLAFSFRNNSGFNEVRVTGAKVIDLGMQLEGKGVVLLVALTPEDNQKVNIRVQIYPTTEDIYLPSNLKLVLLSESGKILQEVQSRTHDHYIQLKRFKSSLGNRFSIQVALNDVSIREEFLLEEPIGF
ncbi:MAG: DUF1822 family protein [Cyanomargarita calcarea GSE-NOS-MK-12-04C]|jgi:hypothetical protein|uniref:DUF1822 family protein n=1 Tax=Cyanomargarita calcarea GSE-NOS-MK-12-04C TaxID=2839659 RepID=A0A951QLT6_9CYAN|nr:DUF1822 family protein [Cyanomargarita calcarea GSE-NOS-MK-12-04C]